MKFKTLAIAAALVSLAGASFADDIVLSTSAAPDVAAFADSALDLTATFASGNAVISQTGAGNDIVAYIDQVGATTSVAVITQDAGAIAGAAIAYISQNGTTNARAVITQR